MGCGLTGQLNTPHKHPSSNMHVATEEDEGMGMDVAAADAAADAVAILLAQLLMLLRLLLSDTFVL